MTKKLLTGVIAVLLLAALAVPAFAAITDSQKGEITQLQKEIAELRKEIIQKYVEAGELTKEQGETIKQNIDQGTRYLEENPGAVGPGIGCGGGYGMMGGYATATQAI